jgi:hypothetical protein
LAALDGAQLLALPATNGTPSANQVLQLLRRRRSKRQPRPRQQRLWVDDDDDAAVAWKCVLVELVCAIGIIVSAWTLVFHSPGMTVGLFGNKLGRKRLPKKKIVAAK